MGVDTRCIVRLHDFPYLRTSLGRNDHSGKGVGRFDIVDDYRISSYKGVLALNRNITPQLYRCVAYTFWCVVTRGPLFHANWRRVGDRCFELGRARR